MGIEDKSQNILELEILAGEVLQLKKENFLRRPILIEFCGSPKSGKSTIINSLTIFLKRNNFKTVVLKERASICPIKNKKGPLFNIWTLTSAVTEIIENIDRSLDEDCPDIIIADRGLFDALCWFQWLHQPSLLSEKPKLFKHQIDRLTEFCLLDLISSSLDLIFVFKVKPETSIIREYANLLTEKRGSIMREDLLGSYNEAIDITMKKHEKNFSSIIPMETDIAELDGKPSKLGYLVTKDVLIHLKEFLTEKIAFFIEKIDTHGKSGVFDLDLIVNQEIKFDDGKNVEKSNNLQPIPIAVITNYTRTKVLVVEKNSTRTAKKSEEHNKLLIYLGGHIRKEDFYQDNITTYKKTLYREIKEEIDEHIVITDEKPFVIYFPKNESEPSQHIAICYIIEMDLDDKAFKLNQDEFQISGTNSLSGKVLDIKDLLQYSDRLESWSKTILSYSFNTIVK